MEKQKFGEFFRKEVEFFRGYVKRVQIQYEQLKMLKENFVDDEVIVQMDFVENYICQFLEEVQFVYWNVLMVIFYFVVVYYWFEDG